MKEETKNKEAETDPCMVCGKPVRWGVDGCPVVRPGQGMMALLGGGWLGMKHYDCEMKETNDKSKD